MRECRLTLRRVGDLLMDDMQQRQAKPVVVGIGSVQSAQAFREMLKISPELTIYSDETAAACKALKLEAGFQVSEDLKAVMNPYAR